MAGHAQPGGGRILNLMRLAGWGGAAALLLAPLVAMQFGGDVTWTATDFAAAGVILGGAGLGMELAVRKSGNLAYRIAAGLAIAAMFGLILVNLAVGFLGSEDNPANMMFLGVLAIALVGALIARFEPAGMARAMFGAAAAQVLVGVTGLAAGWASPGGHGIYEAVMGTSLFGALWITSAFLFRKAV